MIWRHVTSHIIHKLLLFAAVLFFVWACFLGIVRMTLPLLEKHQQFVVSTISSIIGVPLKVDQITTNWRGTKPIIQLHAVKVFDDKQKLKLIIPEVNVSFNLFRSALHQHLEIGLLQIKDWSLNIYQNNNKQWIVSGFSTSQSDTNNDVKLHDIATTLSHIHHIQIANAHIRIRTPQTPNLIMNKVNFDWYSRKDRLSFYGALALEHPNVNQIKFAAEFKSKSKNLDLDNLVGKIYLKTDLIDPSNFLNHQTWFKPWHWHQGQIQGEIWATWQKDHWSNFATQIQMQQLELIKGQKKSIGIKLAKGNIQSTLSLQDSQSIFHINVSSGLLYTGDLFRNALPFDSIQLEGSWSKKQSNNLISIPHIIIKTPYANTTSALNLQWMDGSAPNMSLLTHAELNNLPNASLYLPTGIMPQKVVSWLDQSVSNIRQINADMAWRGPVANFPFDDQTGTMIINGHIAGATLRFAPDWPAISNLVADLAFTSHGMKVTAHSGQFDQLALDNVTAIIPSFESNSHLLLQSTINTDLSRAWHFLQQAPFAKDWQNLLTQSQAAGPVQIKFAGDIPLYDADPTYQGDIQFNPKGNIQLLPSISLTQLQGSLHFSNSFWSSNNLQASLFQQPWQITLSRDKETQPIQLTASGSLNFSDLSKAVDLPSYTTLTGTSPVELQMHIGTSAQAETKWRVKSDLNNALINLPLGYEKPATTASPLLVEGSMSKNATKLNAVWQSPQGKLTAKQQGNTWTINTPNISGSITTPDNDNTPWKIALTYLDLSKIDSSKVNTAKLSKLPAIDFSAVKIILNANSNFGLQFKLRPFDQGTLITQLAIQHKNYTIDATGRSYQTASTNQTQLQGSLKAAKLGLALKALGLPDFIHAKNAAVNFTLNWPGQLWQLDRNQLQGNIRIKTDAGVFQDISDSTNSSLNLGRLLNVLSISQLPKRLTLNFKDFSQKGFQFDNLQGSMKLQPGKINNLNTNITSSIADVNLQGCINTDKQQLNLIAQIKPHLTSSIPVIAAIAGGPIVGAISFVADKVFSPAVGALTEINYLIQGPWSNPKTSKTDRITAQQSLLNCS